MTVRVGVLTISDACSRGERDDASGDAIAGWVTAHNYTMVSRRCIPDESEQIVAILVAWADAGTIDVILTTGGTGLGPRDLTPEATRSAITREAPGIAELLRAAAVPNFPRAALSRGIAGVRASTLIVNLPGSPNAVRDGLEVLASVIDHAVAIVRGDTEHA